MLMLRFVAGPDGVVYYDPSGKAPGVAVEIELEAVAEEITSGKLAESLQATVKEDLLETVILQEKKKFSAGLSLAKKAGILVVGSQNVLQGLREKKVKHVLLAEDAGQDIGKKLYSFKGCCTCLMHTNVYDEALGGYNIVVVGLLNEDKAAPLLKAVKILSNMR